jgi:hypothetical protein
LREIDNLRYLERILQRRREREEREERKRERKREKEYCILQLQYLSLVERIRLCALPELESLCDGTPVGCVVRV